MKLSRPASIEFELATGEKHVVPPPTRGQMRAALALDAADPETETPEALDTRRAEQVRLLTSGAQPPLPYDFLTADEEAQILTALVSQHHGLDPVQAVATAQALKKNVILAAALFQAASASPTSTPPPPSCASPGVAASAA